ncbi:MAG: helix-turn-helix domain-containing protein [Trichormus sp. ATA11-4-KO1]|jgi:transcriptional regulator with XRE-family HTH domain|nr:helix-turn-helix domain-containing protein [Trichormus sp. ATA11-4-KO1]
MTTTPVYLLTIPGNPSIKISQDELRSLLGEIEAELHRSKVYLRAMATLQKLLGASGEQAKMLFKAVGREAIGLAFQQFAQHQKVADIHEQTNTDSIELENTCDLSDIQVNTQKTSTNASPDNVSSTATVNSMSNSQINSPGVELMKRLRLNKKLSQAELAKQMAAEQRLKTMCQIGQQLKQSREFQGLSLSQLNIYTHVPIHQMEAIENGKLELLPEDTLVRGFIRVMGNALGLNGTILAASLPAADMVKSVIPSWSQSKQNTGALGIEIRPMHLYLGYTALVVGAVGGLSLISQSANTGKMLNSEVIIPPSASLSSSSQESEVTAKPGLKSTTSISAGAGIAPPEAL